MNVSWMQSYQRMIFMCEQVEPTILSITASFQSVWRSVARICDIIALLWSPASSSALAQQQRQEQTEECDGYYLMRRAPRANIAEVSLALVAPFHSDDFLRSPEAALQRWAVCGSPHRARAPPGRLWDAHAFIGEAARMCGETVRVLKQVLPLANRFRDEHSGIVE